MRRSLSIGGEFFSAMAESWKKLKTSHVFSSFIVIYSDSNLWFDLLYNWPPNSELLLNNSLLELIYFLSRV